MTNVFSNLNINGAFDINELTEHGQARLSLKFAEEQADAERREAELEVVRNEYYEKGRADAAVEFEKSAAEMKSSAHEAGRQAGRDEAVAEFDPKYAAMKMVFDRWETDKTKFLSELEADALELVLALERRVVGYEIQKSREPVRNVISEAMTMIKDRKGLRVRVSPEDEGYFKQAADGFVEKLGVDIELMGDPGITPGGCVVETAIGSVDAGVETRWNAVVNTFFSGIERGDSDISAKMFEEPGEREPDTERGEGDQDSGALS